MLFISTILTCIVCLAFPQIALATSGTPETALSLGIPCNTCGLCTAPLGICILYYILAALVIILLVLLLTARGRRCPICKERCSRKDHLCPKCGYDFDAGLQSPLSLRCLLSTSYGLIDISKDVIATLAGIATTECFGIVGMVSSRILSDGLNELLGREALSKGVDVTVKDDKLYILSLIHI